MAIDLQTHEWLISSTGREAVRAAGDDSKSWSQIRNRLTNAQRTLVDAQVRLRAKAAAKFTNADDLFFTSKGMQQATDSLIAGYKATRFNGFERIADFCCGIGGDLMQLAVSGQSTGYDLDPLHVLLATANCEASGVNGVAVEKDVQTVDPADHDAWHIDPDRRSSGGRTVRMDQFQPSVDTLKSMLGKNPNGAIKLAPATPVDSEWLRKTELEWIGHSRSCQQVVAWSGELGPHQGHRVATLLRSNVQPVSWIGTEEPVTVAVGIDEYLFEPHAVVLSAGLAGHLAQSFGLDGVIPGGGYLTGSEPHLSPFLTAFRVLESLPFRPKKIRKRLAELGGGNVEVKQRGVDVDPATLQKRWKCDGGRSLTVMVTRRDKSVFAIIAERLTEPT